VAFAAAPAGVGLPARSRDQGGDGVHAHRPGVGWHPPVGRDLQYVAQAVLAHGAAQVRVGAVDLVAGHPGRRRAGLHRAADHRSGERRLGRELDLVRDAGLPAALLVLGPRPRQVERAVDQRMAAARSVGEEDRDLGVLDPSRGAGVLPLHPDRLLALLQIAGLVHHQHRARISEGVGDVAAQIIAHRVGVPLRTGQQMLQAVRGQVTAVLGDRPAVLAIQTGSSYLRWGARDTPGADAVS